MAEKDAATKTAGAGAQEAKTTAETRKLPKAGSAERPYRTDLADLEASAVERREIRSAPQPTTLPNTPETIAAGDDGVKVSGDVPDRTLVRKPYGSEPLNVDPKKGEVIRPEAEKADEDKADEDKRGKAA